MIKREIEKLLKSYIRSFPIVALVGPRQSGKTTLLRNTLPKARYLSLEDPDVRQFAQEDPRRFLATNKPPVILDEAQRAPEIFSYLQTAVDETNKNGEYILSGSQNLLLSEAVSQSLAGRVGTLTLFPLSVGELKKVGLLRPNTDQMLFTGFYPRIWDKKLDPNEWYPNYINTYLERDVRQIKNITDLVIFQKFVKLCAGRVGQLLNTSSLASDIGVSHNTVMSWLSLL